jgi:hypothetical protein
MDAGRGQSVDAERAGWFATGEGRFLEESGGGRNYWS